MTDPNAQQQPQENEDNEEIPVELTNDLDRKIADAFAVFDHALIKKVDVREIGTIVRALGCIPTEAELQEIVVATENATSTGVHLAHFLPHMVQLINEHRLMPAPPEKLLEAFRILDPEGFGFISREELTKLMMEQGEPFTAEEIEEMMAVAVDPATDSIPYEYYINQIMYVPPPEKDIYKLADDIEAAKPPPPPPPKTFSEQLAEMQNVGSKLNI